MVCQFFMMKQLMILLLGKVTKDTEFGVNFPVDLRLIAIKHLDL